MPRPVALVTNYSKVAFPRILSEIEAGPRPPIADWYIGTYGISEPEANAVETAGLKYAPVCAIQPHSSKKLRAARRVTKDEANLLDPQFAGKIPGSDVVPPVKPREWGIEFGRRFRDHMRRKRARVSVGPWQFDEILGKCATSAAHRAFAAGILRGLTDGRPELDEEREQGFVWFGLKPLLGVPGPGFSAEAAQLWDEVERSALFLVGEEYPRFQGSTAAAAGEKAAGHERLLGGLSPQLGRRYVCLLTPGWTTSVSLGGNVDGKSDDFVNEWRRGFIADRNRAQSPRGYGQFRLTELNIRPGGRIGDTVASLHFASGQLA
jgi:hypothetical protein